MSDQFTSSPEFGVQIIAKGAYEDRPQDDDNVTFMVEVTTLRLNPAALNEWHQTYPLNFRNSYATQEEWNAYTEEKQKQKELFDQKIIHLLSLDKEKGGIIIKQAHAEILAAVQIWQIVPAVSEGAEGGNQS